MNCRVMSYVVNIVMPGLHDLRPTTNADCRDEPGHDEESGS